MTPSRSEIEHYLKHCAPSKDKGWYQDGIELPYGLTTGATARPEFFNCPSIWKLLHLDKKDIAGKDVLDIGCNCGYYSMKAKELGANHVVGIDSSAWLPCAKQFSIWKNLDVEWQQVDFWDFDWTRKFDIVLVLSVIYHVCRGHDDKTPQDALELIAGSCKEILIFYTKIRSEVTSMAGYQKFRYFPTLNELADDLDNLGFVITEVDARDKSILDRIGSAKRILDKVSVTALSLKGDSF